MPNVRLGPPLALNGWRKISMGSWRPTGDSSIHLMLELDVEPFLAIRPEGTSLNHFFALALAKAVRQNPEFNALVRFGRIYPRRDVDLFFFAVVEGQAGDGDNLSGIKLERVDEKSLAEVAAEFNAKLRALRESRDADFGVVKRTFRLVPGFLSRLLLDWTGFLLYTLNLPGSWFGAPRDAFGGIMVTNIGSLGIEEGYTPFAPYAHVPVIVSMGAVLPRPRVVEGEVRVVRTMRLGFTLDHRIVDGSHISRLFAELRRRVEQPGWIREEEKAT